MSDPKAGSLRLRSRTKKSGRNSLTCLKIERNSLRCRKIGRNSLSCPGAQTEYMLKPYNEDWVRHQHKNQRMPDLKAVSLGLRSRTKKIERNSLTCLKIGRKSLSCPKIGRNSLSCLGTQTGEEEKIREKGCEVGWARTGAAENP